jgi:hypothetical protein
MLLGSPRYYPKAQITQGVDRIGAPTRRCEARRAGTCHDGRVLHHDQDDGSKTWAGRSVRKHSPRQGVSLMEPFQPVW